MQLGKLITYFETSPALSLLRARHAPYVIAFLDRQFKQNGPIAIPHSDLLAALIVYLEELRESYPNALSDKAESYISNWCSPSTRWLQRFLEAGRDEPLYQLTPHTEDVLAFLNRALDQDLGFVGTESRLKLVIETLSDLVIGSSDDPEMRLEYLREERARLQAEIEQIENDGRISKYQPAQIRERFSTAVSLLRQLQGDFRAVEDSFRGITVQVQQRQLAGRQTRGKILEFALDEEDLLKREDQGVSFYEFVRLILSPGQTERLEKIIREVRRIPDLARQREGLESIHNMITSLQHEAEKVMRTNQRLSATLRRLLDVRAHAERQRIAKLLRDIQVLAASYFGDPDSDDVGLSLELETAIDSPFRRAFWDSPPQFASAELSGFEPDAGERLSAFQQLASLKRLNWHEMRDRIRQVLAFEDLADSAPTLGDLLEIHPPDAGVIEVIGYIQIAADEGYLIEPRSTETVMISTELPDAAPLLVTIPRVTFVPTRSDGHAR